MRVQRDTEFALNVVEQRPVEVIEPTGPVFLGGTEQQWNVAGILARRRALVSCPTAASDTSKMSRCNFRLARHTIVKRSASGSNSTVSMTPLFSTLSARRRKKTIGISTAGKRNSRRPSGVRLARITA